MMKFEASAWRLMIPAPSIHGWTKSIRKDPGISSGTIQFPISVIQGVGFYLDDYSSNCLVYGNIIYSINPEAKVFFVHRLGEKVARQKVVDVAGYDWR